MARTFEGRIAHSQDIFLPMKDNTILIMRKIQGGQNTAVVVLPGAKEHIDLPLYQDVISDTADASTSCFALEPRGHGRSEGRWNIEKHRADIKHVLDLLHAAYRSVYVIAAGASARVMLELENNGSRVHGMVLILPECKDMHPVRVQAPSTVFVHTHHEALLKKLFGPVRVHAGWKEHATAVERAHRAQSILQALHAIMNSEKPIRFSTRK